MGRLTERYTKITGDDEWIAKKGWVFSMGSKEIRITRVTAGFSPTSSFVEFSGSIPNIHEMQYPVDEGWGLRCDFFMQAIVNGGFKRASNADTI